MRMVIWRIGCGFVDPFHIKAVKNHAGRAGVDKALDIMVSAGIDDVLRPDDILRSDTQFDQSA